MFIYNVHTPSKTCAIPYKPDEAFDSLVDRIVTKAHLSSEDGAALKAGNDGAGIVYEHEGQRYSLEDDDDLAILIERFPPASTPSATLHLTPATHHARFASGTASPPPPTSKSRTSASGRKSGKKDEAKFNPLQPNPFPQKSALKGSASTNGSSPSKGSKGPSPSAKKETASSGQAAGQAGSELGPAAPGGGAPAQSQSTVSQSDLGNGRPSGQNAQSAPSASGRYARADSLPKSGSQAVIDAYQRTVSQSTATKQHTALAGPITGTEWIEDRFMKHKEFRPASVMSKSSKRSKWGHNDDEPWWDVHRRLWTDFQHSNGVRTVVGRVGKTDNVRMLLIRGHLNLTVSRKFAMKNNLVDKKYGLGSAGYMGAMNIGDVAITVGSKTARHPAIINEEQHFDVVLGRKWIEKMGVKQDGVDQTVLTYMDNGEQIPCDIVLLKDEEGYVIHVT